MAKRVWTEEQKQAARERYAKAHAAKTVQEDTIEELELDDPNSIVNTPDEDEKVTEAPEPQTTIGSNEDSNIILARAIEAMTKMMNERDSNQGVNIKNGKLTGVIEKYSVDFGRYPDPRERLANEPRLQRFGFKENYALDWLVDTVEYTTIDNVRMKEPKFMLDLINIIHDEATGERTGGRFIEYRMIFHEDPDTALWVARRNGVNVEQYEEVDFLNEMRYLQMRDWLVECFYKPTSNTVKNHKEMVINGKLVDYFEVSDENPTTIPFTDLNTRA